MEAPGRYLLKNGNHNRARKIHTYFQTDEDKFDKAFSFPSFFFLFFLHECILLCSAASAQKKKKIFRTISCRRHRFKSEHDDLYEFA